MMNKRLIAFLPILSLFLSLPLTPANAEVRFGYECDKAGITDVDGAGVSYTCTETDLVKGEGTSQKVVGKKLVWVFTAGHEGKEGDACSKAGITSVENGRSYVCTEVELLQSQGVGQKEKVVGKRLVLKFNDVLDPRRCDPPGWKGYESTLVKKKAAPTPVKKKAKTFQSIAPIKSADYPLIGALAKNTILNQKGSVHNPFVIKWDPTTTELNRKFYSEQIEIAKKYFSPMIPNNSKAHIYILGSDKKWSCDEVFKKASDGLMISTRYKVSSKCYTPEGNLILDAASGAEYTDYPGAGGGLSVLGNGYGMVALSNCDRQIGGEDLLFHEAFHGIQWIYTSHKLDSKEAVKFPTHKQSSPMWMVEGSAQYIGFLLSAEGVRAGAASANNIWTSAAEDKRGFILGNSGAWKKSYEEFAANFSDGYSIGAVMYEYLLAKYGLERTLSFWPESINILNPNDITNNLARRAASKVAFQRVFGLSFEDFFNEVKPYIEWSLEKADLVQRSLESNSGNSSGGATPTPKPTQKPNTSTDIGNPAKG